MTKALIVYESKYGNTKKVAEMISEGMKETAGVETELAHVDSIDKSRLKEFSVILIGSPNHVGGPVGNVKKFIKQLGKEDLAGRKVAAFDTYIGKDFGKAMGKMEQLITKKASGFNLVSPGLSIKVDGMRGPVSEGEDEKSKEFGRKISAGL